MSALRRSRRLEAVEATTGDSSTVDIDMTLVSTTPQDSTASPNSTLKRKVEEDEPGTLDPRPSKVHEPYTKHETYWLLDGSVMLQIGNVRFKLHRSRLAGESSWFRDLFDKCSGAVIEDDQDADEIDPVLEAVEVIEGCDLFYLDIPHDLCPKAADFAALLTAMDDMIDFTQKEPDFPTLTRIFKAANFFRFNRYEEYALRELKQFFPDEESSITAAPIPYASEAILLDRTHTIPAILRCAFYELARRPPGDDALVLENEDEAPNLGAQDDAISVEKLSPGDINRILKLQKHLSLSWNGIYNATIYDCQPIANSSCKKKHSGRSIVTRLQMEQVLDPIRALHQLIARDWTRDNFCAASSGEVRRALTQVREDIWENMAAWLNIVFD